MNDQQHSSADALTEQTELSAEAGRADTGEPASGVKAQDGFQVGSKSVPMKSVDAISAEGFSMDSRREVSGIDGMAVAEELRKAAIQFHNLTHGDPTVIIRPPSAEKRDAIIAAGKRLRRAILATSANETGAEGATWRAGVEAVAKMIEKKAADYLDEYGYVERDTGAVSWGSGNHADAKRHYHSSLVELAEEVRAMVPAMAAAAPIDVEAAFEADAKRLALELECWIHANRDSAVTARWWDSSIEALEQHQKLIEETRCRHADDPKAYYRVRCQLGAKCVDDDMSPRQPAPAPADERRIMDEAANGPHLRPVAWAVYNGWSRICFYMTEEDARDHAQKAQKNHDLSGSLAAFRVVPLYAAPQPAQADAPAEAREPAKVDTKARMDWAAGILRKLPPLDPTYSIISILDDHDREDRDEVLHSIRVFADMRATQALFTLYRAPADSGEARLTDEQKATINWAIRAAVEAGYTADADVLRALLNGADHAE